MRTILVILVMVCFVMSGAAVSGAKKMKGFDVYTIKKERVDQAVDGNRGYIMGTPPRTTGPERCATRTLIAVDIELPTFGTGESEKEVKVERKEEVGDVEAAQIKQRELERQKRAAGKSGYAVQTSSQQQKQKQPRIVEEVDIVEEDEWIK